MERYPLRGRGVNENLPMKLRARLPSGLLLGAMNVLRLQAFCAFDNLKVDYLPFVQGFETLALNGGVMYEYILTGLLGDETKPLFIVEPLDFATGHNLLLFL